MGNATWASGLHALPGALECSRSPRRCDLGRAVRTDDRTGTIELQLSHPDPDLLLTLSEPSLSPAPPGQGLPPGTGPYRIARFVRGRLIDLRRNRFFRPWAPAAQPPGYPDRILWRMGDREANNVAAVMRGRADYVFDPPTTRQRQQILQRMPAQFHAAPLPGEDFLVLNTRAAPFDDVRVRRALNFAVDRSAVARLFGAATRRPSARSSRRASAAMSPTVRTRATRPERDAGRHPTCVAPGR